MLLRYFVQDASDSSGSSFQRPQGMYNYRLLRCVPSQMQFSIPTALPSVFRTAEHRWRSIPAFDVTLVEVAVKVSTNCNSVEQQHLPKPLPIILPSESPSTNPSSNQTGLMVTGNPTGLLPKCYLNAQVFRRHNVPFRQQEAMPTHNTTLPRQPRPAQTKLPALSSIHKKQYLSVQRRHLVGTSPL